MCRRAVSKQTIGASYLVRGSEYEVLWSFQPRCPGPSGTRLLGHMAPFLTLALVQFQPKKGNYPENLARIGSLLAQAATLEPRPRLVCFPETALSGYFLEGGVREHAHTAGQLAADLHRVYAGPPVDVCVGFYEVWRNKLYNSALYLSLGEAAP